MKTLLSVIVPASNEADYIADCLNAVFASDPVPGGAEVVVVANGCRDRTADVARGLSAKAAQAGWRLTVLDLPQGGKPGALNAGDAVATGDMRAYLDADVIVSAPLFAQLVQALSVDEVRYASGTAIIPRAKSWVTRLYARFWQRLPFAQATAPGYGRSPISTAPSAQRSARDARSIRCSPIAWKYSISKTGRISTISASSRPCRT